MFWCFNVWLSTGKKEKKVERRWWKGIGLQNSLGISSVESGGAWDGGCLAVCVNFHGQKKQSATGAQMPDTRRARILCDTLACEGHRPAAPGTLSTPRHRAGLMMSIHDWTKRQSWPKLTVFIKIFPWRFQATDKLWKSKIMSANWWPVQLCLDVDGNS